ncbi:MAG: toprim domain-containing protein [Candidatus Micrarchaeota archaeon]
MKKKIPEKKDAVRLEQLLAQLKQNLVLVEGKRDKAALEALGCKDVIAVAGRKNQLREIISAKKVVVATDLDAAGNELAALIRGELEGSSSVDCETRVLLARLLQMRYFEDAKRKYKEFYERLNENRGE